MSSRTNIATARKIREGESMQVRKRILKTGASAVAQNSTASEVMKSGDDSFQQQMAKLKKFTSKNKANTVTRSRKMEWCQEFEHLQLLAQNTETDLNALLQSIVLTDTMCQPRLEDKVEDSWIDMHSVLAESMELEEARTTVFLYQ